MYAWKIAYRRLNKMEPSTNWFTPNAQVAICVMYAIIKGNNRTKQSKAKNNTRSNNEIRLNKMNKVWVTETKAHCVHRICGFNHYVCEIFASRIGLNALCWHCRCRCVLSLTQSFSTHTTINLRILFVLLIILNASGYRAMHMLLFFYSNKHIQ